MPETSRALHYSAGQWTEGADPVMDAWRDAKLGTSEEDLLESLGYEPIFEIGSRPFGGGFAVWRRPQGPRHVIAVNDDHLTEYLYVEATPDLMDICTRWATLARDAAITELLSHHSGMWEELVRRSVREAHREGNGQ
ncbi:hypothetical protein [Actinomadura sp. HBU206391]|uniref:hypothetical protein n=1 Tax=Actinomadura sp. HBU206391 TaxID=2731692 RepID=UPI00165022B0|nr:hypothetical protein [Actinomadura sp. HBU206391]MBC6458398.1 hypothetical protein [Actinomadura sp. HBU206391]